MKNLLLNIQTRISRKKNALTCYEQKIKTFQMPIYLKKSQNSIKTATHLVITIISIL